jgi:hypothetical protein
VKFITWGGDQWVSYGTKIYIAPSRWLTYENIPDDAQTFQMKLEYANSLCLGGEFCSIILWSFQ